MAIMADDAAEWRRETGDGRGRWEVVRTAETEVTVCHRTHLFVTASLQLGSNSYDRLH